MRLNKVSEWGFAMMGVRSDTPGGGCSFGDEGRSW